jgi:hypothetical protein
MASGKMGKQKDIVESILIFKHFNKPSFLQLPTPFDVLAKVPK